MMLRSIFWSNLAIQVFALPARDDSYHATISHQTLYGKRDGPGGHGGDTSSSKGMSGMGHGGGEQKGASGGGMFGMSGGGGMGGGFTDKIMQSSMTQPLLNAFVGLMPTMPFVKKTLDLPSTFKQPGAKRGNILFGPYNLVTAGERAKTPNPNLIAMDPGATTFMNKADFPKDITLLDATVHLVYADGTPASVANGIYNHHIAFQDTSKKPPAIAACPGQAAKNSVPTSVFVATGEDGNSYNYAPNIPDFDGGYYIGANHGIAVFAEIVNNTNDTKKIFANVEFNYVQGKRKYDVSSATLSVTQCDGGNTAIRPLPGAKIFGITSKDMSIEMDGYLFGVRGHLHDGGDYVAVTVNGKEVCQSKAIYTGDKSRESLSDMSVCKDLIAVKKGDRLAVVAKYDLETHPPREQTGGAEAEEMGLAMFSFAATGAGTPSSSGRGMLVALSGFGSALMPSFLKDSPAPNVS